MVAAHGRADVEDRPAIAGGVRMHIDKPGNRYRVGSLIPVGEARRGGSPAEIAFLR
jgi:hypothetical protein